MKTDESQSVFGREGGPLQARFFVLHIVIARLREACLYLRESRRAVSRIFPRLIVGVCLMFIVFFFFVVTASAATFRIDATGGDCGVTFGSWDQNSLTCTLSTNLQDDIEIVSDNVTLDGAGYSLTGIGSGRGISFSALDQVTVRNLTIDGFSEGVHVEYSRSVLLDSLTLSNNRVGIFLDNWVSNQPNVTVANSSISGSTQGIYFNYAGGHTLTGNTLSSNVYHFYFNGGSEDYFASLNMDQTNTVDGKTVYYLQNISNQTFDASSNAGFFFCRSCSNITVKGLNLSHEGRALFLLNTVDSTIEQNSFSDSLEGIYVENSSRNTFTGNSIARTSTGMYLLADQSSMTDNSITESSSSGVILFGSENTLSGNTVSEGSLGVVLTGQNNNITENTFSGNDVHLNIDTPNLPWVNTVWHNNFLGFHVQPVAFRGDPVFYKSLPEGGNYWKNYDTPEESCTDANNDSICDNPYYILSAFGNADSYPWVRQDGWKSPAQKDPVILIPGILGSWQLGGEWYVDPIMHTYDNLWLALQNAGYEVGTTLFAFPYQWRQSNVLTGSELKNEIAEVKQICGCSKVDLVTHSMGGLVARSYIQGTDYADDVDQLIFLGTPQRGAPESYLRFEAAEGFGDDKGGFALKQIFRLEALKYGYFSLVNYIRDRIVSVEQLLPIDDYLRDASTSDVKPYPTDYPRNAFLENLNVGAAVELLKTRARELNIIGDAGNQSTINVIRIVPDPDPEDNKWFHGFPEDFGDESTDQGLESGPGDGTVPTASQRGLGDDVQDIVVSSEHTDLPTNAQQDVIEVLTGVRPIEVVHATLIQKILLINIKSPVDIQVIDPQGNRIGKDFTNGNFLTESSLSFYSGYNTDIEFITIPNPLDGEYRVLLQGTGTGHYTVETSAIDDQGIQTTSFSGFIDSSIQEELNFEYDAEQNFIGNPEPQDTVPPTISITSPEVGRVYTHQDPIVVQYSVIDNTGVQSSKAILSSLPRDVANGETIDLFFEPIGNHSITVTAKDFLNNSATSTASFVIGATFKSMVQDIERAYSLGWIKDKKVKNVLILEVKGIQKLKRKAAQLLALRAMIVEFRILLNKSLITQEGLELLKGDTEYLLSNL